MTEKTKKKSGGIKKLISILLFVICAALVCVSVFGYVVRGMGTTATSLNTMRTSAVLHAASGGIVDSIANAAKAAALKELRARSDFRSLGMDEVQKYQNDAEAAARAEAETKYSNTDSADSVVLEGKIDVLEQGLVAYHALADKEEAAYAGFYTELVESTPDWTELVGDADDQTIAAKLVEAVPALGEEANAGTLNSLVKMAKAKAAEEAEADAAAAYDELFSSVGGAIGDWSELSDVAADDETLWAAIVAKVPSVAEHEDLKDKLIGDARVAIELASAEESTGEASAEASEEIPEESTETVVDYSYFEESDTLKALRATADAAFDDLWGELVKVIPDLEGLDKKTMASVHETLETVVYSGSLDFSTRFNIYVAEKADKALTGSEAGKIRIAADAERYLIAAIAVFLLAITVTFWKTLTGKMGVPRTIILLFFIYLLLAARLFNISVPSMLGNVLERVCMYGILTLAMLPGIQCGIGLNMGMTLGCIAGLLATVMSLQFDMTGASALVFSCVVGALFAIPLGWAYSLLLNKMKGNEMTIATYVGFSFVSLMCIGWMLLPFSNIKIIWLLRGRGLRVTHSLLGSFAHLLDNLLEFKLFGVNIPTGGLLFFLIFCGVMYLFSRSKIGIAMSAAGSNPRFAESSGINVDGMRTIGTILSTMLAAIGIVIYSQSFGYAQLYTAPRQLGFLAASAILIGGATTSKAKVSHVIIGVFLFEGVLALGQQIANSAFSGAGMSEVMRIMISNGIILYALTQSGGGKRD